MVLGAAWLEHEGLRSWSEDKLRIRTFSSELAVIIMTDVCDLSAGYQTVLGAGR